MGGKKIPEIYHSSLAAMISVLYGELKIGQTVDEMVKWYHDQCHMSPGKWIKAIVINIFGQGINLDNLTDYNLARTLDKLFERGPLEVFSTVCLRAICQKQIPLKYLHNNTTLILVYGDYEYEEATDPDFFITYGHSKDKRLDLK